MHLYLYFADYDTGQIWIMNFFHFADSSILGTNMGAKKNVQIDALLEMWSKSFRSVYLPAQDASVESLALWKDCLSFKQYSSLKAAKFGIRTSELCESFVGYLWNFIVFAGVGSDITTSIDVPIYKAWRLLSDLQSPLSFMNGQLLWFTISV
jgi:hypothetical protein